MCTKQTLKLLINKVSISTHLQMWIPDFFHLSLSWHCHLHLSWDFLSPSLNWEDCLLPTLTSFSCVVSRKPGAPGSWSLRLWPFGKLAEVWGTSCSVSAPSPPLCCVRFSLTTWEERLETHYYSSCKCVLFFVISQRRPPLYFRIIVKEQRWKKLSFSETCFSVFFWK